MNVFFVSSTAYIIVLECLNGCGALVSALTMIAFFALYTVHVCFCTSLHYCCKLYACSKTSCCTTENPTSFDSDDNVAM